MTHARPGAFPDFSAPTTRQRLNELRVVFDVARAPLSTPRLLTAPRGNGRPMFMLPGFGAADGSMIPLRRYLNGRNHDVHGWGLGRNTGDVVGLVERFLLRLERRVEATGRPANLAGWSLGGVVAREATRERPDLVHQVATFGTPLFGPRASAASRAFSAEQIEHIETLIADRAGRALPRPIMAIYSRNDGIVDWRACIDEVTPFALNVEVSATHFGMGISPDVMMHLAQWFAER
ncbi:MAG: hypothetical protein ABIP17_07865 [Ilumatobacteraceae bacterium]